MGIVNHVVPPEDLEAHSAELAARIADGPIKAFEYMKPLISRSLELSLDDMLQYEIFAQSVCMQSCDHKEGVRSFYDKRAPLFAGR